MFIIIDADNNGCFIYNYIRIGLDKGGWTLTKWPLKFRCSIFFQKKIVRNCRLLIRNCRNTDFPNFLIPFLIEIFIEIRKIRSGKLGPENSVRKIRSGKFGPEISASQKSRILSLTQNRLSFA